MRSNQICLSSVAVFGLSLQELWLIHLRSVNLLPAATTSGNSLCLQRLESRVQVCFEGVVVGLNGGLCAYSPVLEANCLHPELECQAWNETKRGHNSGMTPVNRKRQEQAERTRELPGGNARSL